jgi:ribonuclease HI
MKEVQIYTDGACRGNPGPGGWGAILVFGEHTKELTDGERSTTNNRMELMGAIKALEQLKYPCRVTLTTDSKYLCDAVTKVWVYSWKKKGWMRTNKEPAANPDLWERLLALLERHEVTFVWVKGHAGHPFNERCDELATASADKYKQ